MRRLEDATIADLRQHKHESGISTWAIEFVLDAIDDDGQVEQFHVNIDALKLASYVRIRNPRTTLCGGGVLVRRQQR